MVHTLTHTLTPNTVYKVSCEVKWMDSCAAVSADNSHYHEYLALNVRFMSKNRFNTIANENVDEAERCQINPV